MRITNKIIDNYSVYNLNTNKGLLDDLNSQMSTRKKINDPTRDPVTGITSLRFRGSLSEYAQYLGKNVTDAVSWTESTQSAIDTAKEIMRSLKAEYTSASNGTNESTDRWTYYDNMVNLVNEYFSVGDTTNENRYLFSGARTGDSLTFSEKNFADRAKEHGGHFDPVNKDTYKYRGITENFYSVDDLEVYSFTARTDKSGNDGSSGITDKEISDLSDAVDETNVQNVEAFRIRLAYENLDKKDDQKSISYEYYSEEDGNLVSKSGTTRVCELIFKNEKGEPFDFAAAGLTPFVNTSVECIENDWVINQTSLEGNRIYLNTTTGNLIFGSEVQGELSKAIAAGAHIEFQYDKSTWQEGDAKPEHYFDCVDVGLGIEAGKTKKYDNHEQEIYYNVGEGQQIKVNSNAEDVFTLDARRDLNELRDALTAVDNAQAKIDKLKEMQEDTLNYDADDQEKIADLLRAVTKEYEYAKGKADTMLSNGITRSGNYFDVVNLAGTEIGTAVNRLNLIKNRLTEHQSTTTAQASDNENIDIATLAVQVNSATLSFSAALQITGKISQQSLVNYL